VISAVLPLAGASHHAQKSDVHPIRTIQRWKDAKLLRFIGDRSRGIYIDMDDIKKMQAEKPHTVHPVRDEIKRIASNEENQEQRIAKLESLVAMLLEREEVLQKRVDFLVSQRRAGAGNLLLLPRRAPLTSSAESRGLPAGTERLAPYVERHKANISEVKALHTQRLVDLTIHLREGEVKRNKQEWWITSEQQEQLVCYWQEHHISYEPCDQCQGCKKQMQQSEIG
jgi:hypothetical protein